MIADGKNKVAKHLETFKKECQERIVDESSGFGPSEFEEGI